jgi:GTPase SAR1 family protein
LKDRKSFEGSEGWLKQVKNTRGNECLIVFIANKSDLEREVTEEEARNFAKEREMLYFEVSAKTGAGIEDTFRDICLALPNDTSFVITQSKNVLLLILVIN